jgi:8-oxo-dGTP diphosphatase
VSIYIPRVASHPIPRAEFKRIFSRVPRLTVEVVIFSEASGVLLARRDVDPFRGHWNIPGGTVLIGERVTDAVRRVALDELGVSVGVGELLGYIEYPSLHEMGLGYPVGLAFRALPEGELPNRQTEPHEFEWFRQLPGDLFEEQKAFLTERFPSLVS